MEGLGINPVLLVTQIINFLIMVVVLKLLIYKPLTKALDDKKKKAQEEQGIREKLFAEEGKLEERRKRLLNEARDEAREVVQEAIKESKKKTTELLADERQKFKEEQVKATRELAKEREQIAKDARDEALKLSVLISQKLLGEKLTVTHQRKLVDSALDDLKRAKLN